MDIYLLNTRVFEDSQTYEKCLASVSDIRREKVSAYRFDKDKFLSLAAGVLTDTGLKKYGLSESAVQMRFNEYEKPYIENNNIFFNVSHSGTYAVCAFSEREVGVDIEEISEISNRLIEKVCVSSEREYLFSLPEGSAREDAFFRLWTAKESYMKMLGTGFSLPPKKIELSFENGIQLVSGAKDEEVFFTEYDIPGYKLTVCQAGEKFCGKLTDHDMIEE